MVDETVIVVISYGFHPNVSMSGWLSMSVFKTNTHSVIDDRRTVVPVMRPDLSRRDQDPVLNFAESGPGSR
jgi:hypothetical protein